MAIISPALLKNLFIAFKKHFQDGLKEAETDYERIATIVPSSTASNIYAWLGLFPKMRKFINRRVIKNMKADGYSIVNETYESTVGVPRVAIEDDQVSLYSSIMRQAGRTAKRYPGETIWALVNDAENHICYDGQNFFDTDHPVAENEDGSGTITNVSNILAPSGSETAVPAWYVMVTSEVIKPFLWQDRIKPDLESKTDDGKSDHVFMEDEYLYGIRARGGAGVGYWQMCVKSTAPLTAANFEKACEMLETYTADGGVPLAFKADLLVVPRKLKAAAEQILKLEKVNGTTNLNYNATDLLISPWLNQ